MTDETSRWRSWLFEQMVHAGVESRKVTIPLVSPIPYLIILVFLMDYFSGNNPLMYLYNYWATLVFLLILVFLILRSLKNTFVEIWDSENPFEYAPTHYNIFQEYSFYNSQYWEAETDVVHISSRSREKIGPHLVISFWNVFWSLVLLIVSVAVLFLLNSLNMIPDIVSMVQSLQTSVSPIVEIFAKRSPTTEVILSEYLPPISLKDGVILTIVYFFPILAIVSTAGHLVKISREVHLRYLCLVCTSESKFLRSELLHTVILLLAYATFFTIGL